MAVISDDTRDEPFIPKPRPRITKNETTTEEEGKTPLADAQIMTAAEIVKAAFGECWFSGDPARDQAS